MRGKIFTHKFGNGRSRSREKAKTVRARACMAVKVTNSGYNGQKLLIRRFLQCKATY